MAGPLGPWACTEGLAEEIAYLYEKTDYAIVGCSVFKSLWETPWYMRGLTQMLEGLYLNRDFVQAFLCKVLELSKIVTRRFLDIAAPYIQVFRFGDDLATQQGPFFSPQLFREFLKPYFGDLIQFVRKRTSAKIFFHTCGNIVPLLDDLIEIGVDILNPVQVSADGMDTQQLKSRYGERLCFWGAVDTQHVLPLGNVEEVKKEVEKRIGDLAHGGGDVLAPVHNVQSDVPSENMLTMYQHAKKVGHYPL